MDNDTPERPSRGRTGKPSRVSRLPSSDPDQIRAIRAWAAANDYQVSTRGRIPKSVQEAFAAAH